jgi:hypothetical protein
MAKVVGMVAAVGALGALAYSQLPEIKRYMKIRRM